MPSDNHVKRAMSLIEADKTKVLGITVGSRENVQPGQYIPRSKAQTPPKLAFSGASPTPSSAWPLLPHGPLSRMTPSG
ncbi:hypothetical protein PENANT_c055G04223 [Penicillium antarcticum]|uniref:Uncharacterized protein n=1 Tax=Penicillium antarcticum TaxID=416450 RepID=A0A1V6PQL4_9EURO|nr:uncharacterized protein N7508_001934 [Penicillium antarcticum]KAJ5317426.1 hypothetical protein N7508_001934 [Penicillium antarcticum]OQD79275.1 hypothetical protein PENANT_c055G04223 [Penicillium antarcticum]